MVLHSQVDWRTPEKGLEWDVALVESVFHQVLQQYEHEASIRVHRRTRGHDHSNHESHEHPAHEGIGNTKPFEHRLVTKADLLIGLKNTELMLSKRPFLRVLYTNLACCSNEKEMESVASYVKYRLRERTLSFAMVRDRLERIYKQHMDSLAFEERVNAFKEAAKAASPWCVRDHKAICRSPSQFYGVHNIPVKPKTQQQIEDELRVLKEYATAVANTAITLVVSKLVDAMLPASRQRSAKIARRTGSGKRELSSKPSARVTLVARAKMKRDQEELEARRKQLRLDIFSPGFSQTQKDSSFGELTCEEEIGLEKTIREQRQQELLSLVEACGDVTIARQLLQHKIPYSGFRRVSEHLTNLGDSATDAWAVVKLWRTVYRSHTVQTIQQLEKT